MWRSSCQQWSSCMQSHDSWLKYSTTTLWRVMFHIQIGVKMLQHSHLLIMRKIQGHHQERTMISALRWFHVISRSQYVLSLDCIFCLTLKTQNLISYTNTQMCRTSLIFYSFLWAQVVLSLCWWGGWMLCSLYCGCNQEPESISLRRAADKKACRDVQPLYLEAFSATVEVPIIHHVSRHTWLPCSPSRPCQAQNKWTVTHIS